MDIVPPHVVLISLGLLTALGALPLRLGLVRPNRFYGIRVPAAFASGQSWYAINRFGGSRLLRFGIFVAVAGVALARYPKAPFWVPILCLVGTLVLLLLTVRSIERFARSL